MRVVRSFLPIQNPKPKIQIGLALLLGKGQVAAASPDARGSFFSSNPKSKT
jgi:hypothetical protein